MDKLAFNGAEGAEVMFAFPDLVLEVGFEFRVLPPCDERGIEKDMPQVGVAALGNISLALDGRTAFMNSAVEADICHELFGRGKSVDVANVGDECGSGKNAHAGNGS